MPRVQATNRVSVSNIPYSLSFNGISQKVALTTMGDLGSSMVGAVSWGVWVQTSDRTTGTKYMIGATNAVGGNYALFCLTRSTSIGYWWVDLRDNTGRLLSIQAQAKQVNDGQWHLLIFTKDPTNTPAGVQMYIDGVASAKTTVNNTGYADPIDFTRQVALGASNGSVPSNFFSGKLSRPFFFKRALTPTEVATWYYNRSIPSGEFAGYLMNEGATATTADTKGNYPGTITIDTMWGSDTPYKTRPQRQL